LCMPFWSMDMKSSTLEFILGRYKRDAKPFSL
jgi:hypothetical protein